MGESDLPEQIYVAFYTISGYNSEHKPQIVKKSYIFSACSPEEAQQKAAKQMPEYRWVVFSDAKVAIERILSTADLPVASENKSAKTFSELEAMLRKA